MLLRIPCPYKMASAPHLLGLPFAISSVSLQVFDIPNIIVLKILIAALALRLPPTCARLRLWITAAAVHLPKTGLLAPLFTKEKNVPAKKKPWKRSRSLVKNVKQKPNSWKNHFGRSPRMRSSHPSPNPTPQLKERTRVRSNIS